MYFTYRSFLILSEEPSTCLSLLPYTGKNRKILELFYHEMLVTCISHLLFSRWYLGFTYFKCLLCSRRLSESVSHSALMQLMCISEITPVQ